MELGINNLDNRGPTLQTVDLQDNNKPIASNNDLIIPINNSKIHHNKRQEHNSKEIPSNRDQIIPINSKIHHNKHLEHSSKEIPSNRDQIIPINNSKIHRNKHLEHSSKEIPSNRDHNNLVSSGSIIHRIVVHKVGIPSSDLRDKLALTLL